MNKILITIKYNTDDELVKENIDCFMRNQDGVIREVDGNYTIENVIRAIILAQYIYKKFGDDVVIIKGYEYINTLNLSKSKIMEL